MNRSDTLLLIADLLKHLHEYEDACKFRKRFPVPAHAAVLPDVLIDEALAFAQKLKTKLHLLEKKWHFVHPNIKKSIRNNTNVFFNMKIHYDVFLAEVSELPVPILFRQEEVKEVIEQVMKEKERAEKRFHKERNKLQVKTTSPLDGFEEALKVAKDRRHIEDHYHVSKSSRPHSSHRSGRKALRQEGSHCSGSNEGSDCSGQGPEDHC